MARRELNSMRAVQVALGSVPDLRSSIMAGISFLEIARLKKESGEGYTGWLKSCGEVTYINGVRSSSCE